MFSPSSSKLSFVPHGADVDLCVLPFRQARPADLVILDQYAQASPSAGLPFIV